MKIQIINYRIVTNPDSELYRHSEFVGENLEHAEIEYNKAVAEKSDNDTVVLQKETDYNGIWETIK